MKWFTRVWIVALLAVCAAAGSAWAAPAGDVVMRLMHESGAAIVNGKTEYYVTKEYPNVVGPLLELYPGFVSTPNDLDVRFAEINFGLVEFTSGTLTLYSDGVSRVAYRDRDDAIVDAFTFDGEHRFPITEDTLGNSFGDEGWLVNESGFEFDFMGDTEKTLSAQPFSIDAPGFNFKGSGVLPTIKTTDEQMKSCAPFMEFKQDTDGNVTGIEVRFVNPSVSTDIPLTQGAENPIRFAARALWLEFSDTAAAALGVETLHFSDRDLRQESGLLRYTLDFADSEIGPFTCKSDDIKTVDIDFIRDDATFNSAGENGVWLYYAWDFWNINAVLDPGPKSDPENPIAPPDAPKVDEAESAAEAELADMEDRTFVAAETANVTDKSAIFISDGIVDSVFTSSAIKVSQNVPLGGAAVVGAFNLPLRPTSFNGKLLPTANNSADVARSYQLLKYFEHGNAIDLIKEFGIDDILDTTKLPDMKFKPVLVVIDDKIPAENPESGKTVRAPYNPIYGVHLSENKQYLYVYDGDPNGSASDPIALVAKSEESEESEGSATSNKSNGGCDAGYGLIALLIAGLAAFGRRRA
jgi:hypothetical protein